MDCFSQELPLALFYVILSAGIAATAVVCSKKPPRNPVGAPSKAPCSDHPSKPAPEDPSKNAPSSQAKDNWIVDSVRCGEATIKKFGGGSLTEMPLLLHSHAPGTKVPIELRRTETGSLNVVHLSESLVHYHQFWLTERDGPDLSRCESLSFQCMGTGTKNKCKAKIKLIRTGVAIFEEAHSDNGSDCMVGVDDLLGYVVSVSDRSPGLQETIRSYLIHEVDPKVLKMENDHLRKITELPVYGVIGRGGFGTVLTTYIPPSCFAVKVAKKKPSKYGPSFESEILHSKCGNLLRGWSCETKKYELFLMEVGSPLDKLLPLDKKRVGYTAIQALNGLENLHQRGFVHRDVKTNNMLCYHSGRVVLADFGVACHKLDIKRYKEAVGNCLFHSPEAIRGEEIWPESVAPCRDTWGLIASLYQCLFRKFPFDMLPISKRAHLVQQLVDQKYMENLDIAALRINKDDLEEFKLFFYGFFVEKWQERLSNDQLRAIFYLWSGFKETTPSPTKRNTADNMQ